MKHAVAGYKLGRDSEHRRALFRNLAAAVLQHGQITTTLPKAKAVQPFVEKLISLARKGDLASRRRVASRLQDRLIVEGIDEKSGEPQLADRTLVQKLFEEIAPRYVDRPGGYTRIIRLSQHRIGDGSDLVVLQLVGDESGPTVRGRHSRRRQKQDNRTAYTAQLRRSRAGESEPTEEEPEADEQLPTDEETVTDAEQASSESDDQPETAVAEASDSSDTDESESDKKPE